MNTFIGELSQVSQQLISVMPEVMADDLDAIFIVEIEENGPKKG